MWSGRHTTFPDIEGATSHRSLIVLAVCLTTIAELVIPVDAFARIVDYPISNRFCIKFIVELLIADLSLFYALNVADVKGHALIHFCVKWLKVDNSACTKYWSQRGFALEWVVWSFTLFFDFGLVQLIVSVGCFTDRVTDCTVLFDVFDKLNRLFVHKPIDSSIQTFKELLLVFRDQFWVGVIVDLFIEMTEWLVHFVEHWVLEKGWIIVLLDKIELFRLLAFWLRLKWFNFNIHESALVVCSCILISYQSIVIQLIL